MTCICARLWRIPETDSWEQGHIPQALWRNACFSKWKSFIRVEPPQPLLIPVFQSFPLAREFGCCVWVLVCKLLVGGKGRAGNHEDASGHSIYRCVIAESHESNIKFRGCARMGRVFTDRPLFNQLLSFHTCSVISVSSQVWNVCCLGFIPPGNVWLLFLQLVFEQNSMVVWLPLSVLSPVLRNHWFSATRTG